MWPHEAKADDTNILYTSEEKPSWHLLSVKAIAELADVLKPAGLYSVPAHKCMNFQDNDSQLLGVDDTMAGYCWWCKEKVPNDLKGLWLLHNFEAAGRQDMSDVERLIEEREE
jgi:hypothetical protein